ncbi:MAG: MIP/aquaporin family protein [Pyrinomonadaceae bacterium]
MVNASKFHWPEYAIEAWCLATFMFSACSFGILLFNPASPASGLNLTARMVLMGIAMGSTAVAIICSPWGKRSGAHFNPAVTLVFLRLGKIAWLDSVFYIAAQFIGGVLGVALAWLIFGRLLEDGAVNFVVTMPGSYGVGAAFAAEVVISFFMMTMILFTSNSLRISRLTPFFAGTLVAIYIAVESPVSGMSMNPARSFASAAVSGNWTAAWIYFVAPPVAMLTAAELFVRTRGIKAVLCAKLNHGGSARCIFNCGWEKIHHSDTENKESTEIYRTNESDLLTTNT